MSLTSQSPKSTTAISASWIINIPSIGIIGHKVEGFSADDAFSAQSVKLIESYLGIDGLFNAGFIPQLKQLRGTLAPTSTSLEIFNLLFYEMERQEEAVWINSSIIQIPSINANFALTNGVLSEWTPIPNVKKVVQPVAFTIDWSKITKI